MSILNTNKFPHSSLKGTALAVCAFLLISLSSCVWSDNDNVITSKGGDEYLPLDDSEYPYAGIPRIVIETENFRQIRDTETEIPARLQIWGDSLPDSQVIPLTIRGRGNSSFISMPKYSIKLKFDEKQALFGMPKDKDWALIANFADRTLLKNFITYKLSEWLGAEYAPRTKFVEVYLNRKYLGVYLLTETIKANSHRVDIPKDNANFLIEKSNEAKEDEAHIVTKKQRTVLIIKSKNKTEPQAIAALDEFANKFEDYIQKGNFTDVESHLDMEDFFRFFWIQEFSKNPDGNFHRSIFFTIEDLKKIHFGPLWDFDVAYGNRESYTTTDWYAKPCKWFKFILNNHDVWQDAISYWKLHHNTFTTLPDSISKYAQTIRPYTVNEFKRWPTLENTENWMFKESYESYDEGIDSLNSWIKQRIQWIDKQVK